jgi:LmbE family N-acetylglucosaminyl deacetylase
MKWTYLSPHFDDVSFSCGGLVWDQIRSGEEVCILTVCAGNPPPGPISAYAQGLHARWKTGPDGVDIRRAENIRSCRILGASWIDLSFPDAIYRRNPLDNLPMYASDAALFGDSRPEEARLKDDLRHELELVIPGRSEIVSPLAIGGHVDHRLVRAAAEMLDRPIWYYADFPYLAKLEKAPLDLEQEMTHELFPISKSGLEHWQRSIAAHASQLSTFWESTAEMEAAVQAYWDTCRGIRLLRFP